LPSHLVPVIYLLRGVLLIQATALVYFGLIPAEFPHTPSGYLHPAFGRLKLEYPTQNVSPDRPESLNVRLQRMEQACGPTIYQTLLEMNSLDLELLELARIEIRSRRDRIPVLSAKARA
jgi:hypothetical protein